MHKEAQQLASAHFCMGLALLIVDVHVLLALFHCMVIEMCDVYHLHIGTYTATDIKRRNGITLQPSWIVLGLYVVVQFMGPHAMAPVVIRRNTSNQHVNRELGS